MIIYITTNKINGKKYIGKDEADNINYLGSGLQLKLAIKKYGRENFVKEILATCFDKIELNELEKYYIEYYNAQKSNLFYNIAPGGTGGLLRLEYSYLEKSVYELDITNYQIIKKYESSKKASIENVLNYKCLNAVCNGSKKYVKNRLFISAKDYCNYSNFKKLETPYNLKYIHLSYKTGVYYYNLKDLYYSEFCNYKTFSAFKNQVFKNKCKFITEFLTTRI